MLVPFQKQVVNMRYLTWLMLLLAGLIGACGNAEHDGKKDMIEELILYSPDRDKKPLYKLSIPSNYIVSDAEKGRALIKAAYPGMVGFSPEIRGRFYNEDGASASDSVRVFFSIQPDYKGDDRSFKNRNDTESFLLESLLRRAGVELSKTQENIVQNEKVKTYISYRYVNHQKEEMKTYVISQEEGRASIITCPYKNRCEGETDWNGKFSISYKFSINHLKNMVDLDESIIDLFNAFNPTPLIDEE